MSQGPPPPQHELSPGDVCDGYRILSLIAAGGMGDVYEAVHDASGLTVAVKCLKVRHRNKEDARARMKMEAVVLSELQHENLVQVYDAGVTDQGAVWFAMERLHGQTLRDVLYRAGRLPIPAALHYASEIADGVDAVHEVNVIHRDLKPENVFVTADNIVKVLDLGTGKFTGYGLNSTDRMRVIGTTAYMSPEQIKGLRVDPRADVYGLGLMLYEMIAGRHALIPEDGTALPQGVEQVAFMQLQTMPKPLSDVALGCPRYVSAIVDKAIAKEREQRFPNMAALSRELRAARKRFVAENQFDGMVASALGEGLREKFGAPPRSTPAPRAMVAKAAGVRFSSLRDASLASLHAAPLPTGVPPVKSVADVPLDPGNEFPTEIQAPIDFTLDGSTPPPAYVPTMILSSSSVPGLPGEFGVRSDLTDRALPPDDVRNRTTQTNPIGFVRAAEPSQEDSIDIPFKSEAWLAFWRHPFFHRAVATLGLGALIGVPPAILGVIWTRHHGGLPSAPFSLSRTGLSPSVPSLASVQAATFPVAVDATKPSAAASPSPVTSEDPSPALAGSVAAETAVRVPRARPKTPSATTSAIAVDDAARRSDAKRAARASDAEPTPKTILPPSGL